MATLCILSYFTDTKGCSPLLQGQHWWLKKNLTNDYLKQNKTKQKDTKTNQMDLIDPTKHLVVRKKWHLRRNPEGKIGCGQESRQREQNVQTLWDRTWTGTQVGTETDASPGDGTETSHGTEVKQAQAAKGQFTSPLLRNQGKTEETGKWCDPDCIFKIFWPDVMNSCGEGMK